MVQKIDEDSTQLAEALKSGVPIMITTLQKFPFVTGEGRRHCRPATLAVIVDEAHSSQSGEAAADAEGRAGGDGDQRAGQAEARRGRTADYEEEILKTMAKRGQQPNLSFFAFTATPKYKTLETSAQGRRRQAAAVPHLLHAAGHRGRFILDVLKNYTTYKTYFRLIKSVEDDPKLRQNARPRRALARFVSFHPTTGAEDRSDDRALPRSTHAQDRRPGEGDGGDQLPRSTRSATSRSSTSTSRRRATPTSDAGGVLGDGGTRRGRRVHRGRDEQRHQGKSCRRGSPRSTRC